MNDELQTMKDDHVGMLACVLVMRHLADSVGTVSPEEIVQELDQVIHLVDVGLRPHTLAEEQIVYPVVDRLLGSSHATCMLMRDHAEIDALTRELKRLRSSCVEVGLSVSEERTLRRVLYGLDAVIRLHVAREEETCLPLLVLHLAEKAQRSLMERLERREQTVRKATTGASGNAGAGGP